MTVHNINTSPAVDDILGRAFDAKEALQKENATLKARVLKLQKENAKLKNKIAKLQAAALTKRS